MKTTKRLLTTLLSVFVIITSCSAMISFAEGETTETLISKTFLRVGLTAGNQTLEAETPKTLSFTVPESGSYAIFLNRGDANPNAFSAIFTQSGALTGQEEDYSVSVGATDEDAASYKYNYIRVGASAKKRSSSVYLYKGLCTVSLTAASATTVTFFDLRGTDIEIDGTKQGINPVDYNDYASVSSSNHVNGELKGGKPLSEGYAYYNSFPDAVNTRQIHVDSGQTVTYKFNVTKAQNYKLQARATAFVWSGSDAGQKNVYFKTNLDGNMLYTSPTETLTIIKGSNSGEEKWNDLGVVHLTEGEHTLNFTPTGGLYIHDILIEGTDEPIIVNAETLPKSIQYSDFSTQTATVENGIVSIDSGESVTASFKVTGAEAIDLYMAHLNVSAPADLSYQIDENTPQDVTLTGPGKLFTNETLSAGVHTLTLTSKTDGFQFKALELISHSDTVLGENTGETIQIQAGAIVTPVPLKCGKFAGWSAIEPKTGNYALSGGGSFRLTFQIADEGYYTLYTNATMPQTSFTVYADGEDVTNVMYQDTTVAHNVQTAQNQMNKKLTQGLVHFAPGEHTFQIAANSYVSFASFELRRADAVLKNDIAYETVIPAWDFQSYTNVGAAWFFPTQYWQSNSEKIQSYARGIYKDLRNVIAHDNGTYTYLVNAEESGYYDFAAYFTNSNNTAEIEFTVDDVYPFYAVGTPENSVAEAKSTEPMFLTEGLHTIKIYRNKRTYKDGTVRLYAISFTKSSQENMIIDAQSTTVNASFDEAVSGTAIAAIYKDGKLTDLAEKAILNANNVSIEMKSAQAPDSAKVFVWDSIASMKPVISAKEITTVKYKKINVFLMGDSVCVGYGADSFPQQGWGYYFGEEFNENINMINKAVGGTSSKTFKTNGFWTPIENALKKGDFVFINFGLNDFYNISETGKGTTIEQYKANLTEYCEAVKAKGATPILVSTIPECKEWSAAALIERSAAMRETAAACGVTFLDLNTYLTNLWIYEDGKYSETKTTQTFDYYYLSETAFHRIEEETGKTIPQGKWDYIENTPDRTHVNIDGAKFVSESVAMLLSETDVPLKSYLK